MDDQTLTLPEIKKRVIKSFISLSSRQIVLRAIGFVSINIILASVLPVETLGIFNIATAIVTFFAFFSDIGLAASLIQRKDQVKDEHIQTTFTIQFLIVGILSLIIILAAPIFAQFYNLNENGVWLVRVLGLSFFLTSLKVVPSVMLERQLHFNPLVTVEVIETLIFNSLLILLSFNGFGVWAFSYAAIAKAISGAILIYLLAPTKVGFSIKRGAAKELLAFGIPFQINSLLALLKDRLVPLVVAGMIGPLGIGYITWAQALAFLPLEVMNIVNRITFPAFSRLQHDKEALSRAVQKSLFMTTLLSYPLVFGLGAVLPSIITYVVSSKWQPALLACYLFLVNVFWSIISTTFTSTLNAIGQIKTTLKLMVMWTTLTWILTPILVYFYGFNGVAISSFLISFTSIVTIILVKRLLEVKLLEALTLPILASFIMGIVIYFIAQNFVRDKISLFVVVALGGAIYSLIVILFGKEQIISDFNKLRGNKHG